jgi:hypothetical protein
MFGLDFELKGCDVSLDGLKIAKVISNADATAQEKVFVRVIGVHRMDETDPEYGIWARHSAPSKGTSGEIPEVDDMLYGFFVNNDPNQFVWIGFCRHAA